MKTTTMSVLLTVTILLSAAFLVSLGGMGDAQAAKAERTYTKMFGQKTAHIVCGDQLCSASQESAAAAREAVKQQEAMKSQEQAKKSSSMKESSPMKEQKMTETQTMTQAHTTKIVSGTLTSAQDPGIGHESHQLAIILPPSDKVYKGTLSYAASEPVQLVALTGPLKAGEDKGQPIWTPDGKTKFALTFLDPNQSSGTWNFVGNAIAVHTKHTDPFTVTYTVSYAEMDKTDTVKTGTITSDQDPGIGHESHQLAIILPPSDQPYSGILNYAASEPVQLVALTGPLKAGEDKGQPIWTPDGKTKFALTFVDKEQASGMWSFAGNALAVHTKHTDPFTVTYTVSAWK